MMRIVFSLLAIALAAACGCGSRVGAGLASVQGTVACQGKPIARGSLVFEVSGMRPAYGKIVDGRIAEVMTYAPQDGCPIGLAHIAVFATQTDALSQKSDSPRRPTNPQEALADGLNYTDPGKPLVASTYNDPATSGLTWDIKAGENTVSLELEPAS